MCTYYKPFTELCSLRHSSTFFRQFYFAKLNNDLKAVASNARELALYRDGLDRLLSLLETGSTAAVRKSAAEQLGEVQKLHPHELNNLLNKVHHYLCSTQWDTRIAAGQAIDFIAQQVHPWKPVSGAAKSEHVGDATRRLTGFLRLTQFDIDKVLSYGAQLLGSQGSEYDIQDVAGLSSAEQLKQQKLLLNKRLGLDVCEGLSQGDVGSSSGAYELFKEEDLIIKQEADGLASTTQDSVRSVIERQLASSSIGNGSVKSSANADCDKGAIWPAESCVHTDASNANSKYAGEDEDDEPPQNKRSRKMTNVIVDQPGSDKILLDKIIDTAVSVDEPTDWPFTSFCDVLKSDMLHTNWERRHGALTALRSIIRSHGCSAGKTVDMADEEKEFVNQVWLEDFSVRLVCILALDRFGDFVSDEVVAPVRETCAQALGMTSLHMSVDLLHSVVGILVQLLLRPEWEARHGGLLGVKYILAARQDVAESILKVIWPALFQGLSDPSDDVRTVAASSLLPVTDSLITSMPQQVVKLVDMLWSILDDLDDLTSSTNSIMSLLSTVLVHPAIESVECSKVSLADLLPRLWPFLHHSISSVRRAALKTMFALLLGHRSKVLLNFDEKMMYALTDSMRHVYQRCLLEGYADILQNVYQVWCELLACCPSDRIVILTAPLIGSWLCLMMQPATVPFDSSLLVNMRHSNVHKEATCTRRSAETPAVVQQRYFIGGGTCLAESTRERDSYVIRARCMAAKMIGMLSAHISRSGSNGDHQSVEQQELSPVESLGRLFSFYLGSRSALQKSCAASVITEWGSVSLWSTPVVVLPDTLRGKLHECLTESVYYDEVLLAFGRMQTDCRDFLAGLRQAGINLADQVYSTDCVLSLDQANSLCTTVYENVRAKLRPTVALKFDERRAAIQVAVTQTTNDQMVLINRVQTTVASTVIRWNCLPDKMNPVVRPLMDALKREENADLQENSANSLAKLVLQCATAASSPNGKIIKNLCTMLCSDAKFTPVIGSTDGISPSSSTNDLANEAVKSEAEPTCDTFSGILTMNMQNCACEPGRGRRPASFRRSVSNCNAEVPAAEVVNSEEDNVKRQVLVQRRGAMLALTAIARDAGEGLPTVVPTLWDAMLGPLESVAKSESLPCSNDQAQQLVHCLQILQVVGPSTNQKLHAKLLSSIDHLLACLEHPYTGVRHMAGRCLGMLGRLVTSEVMERVIRHVVPLLGSSDNDCRRQGAIEAIALVIDCLGIGIVPYVALLVLPVLGRMSDQNDSVRLMATSCFASLVRLMPLDKSDNVRGSSDTLSESLRLQKKQECGFLEQLLDPRKIENYAVPVPIKAELRKYQQDGVNWLAFLARFKLHGILCDDMGLGKTLQTLCVVAGDHYLRQLKYKESEVLADCAPLPSIVICPPTVTGHWVYEIEKFVSKEYLSPLHYVGPPVERLRLQKQFRKHNIILASYDVVRNDIDFFSRIQWNYCILDEGHMIKNSKTKVSKAVKQLACNHRLILSGTPIQNNVLELWSLFDFLMPGFLGTEKQFQAMYGRPILQSRDPKSSAKDQEAGALAMESLHRQVLPFLLRRLKDDVLQDLPPKIIQDYYCDLSPLQVQLYEDFTKSQAKKSLEDILQSDASAETVSTPAVHIFQALQYLRKVCNHPALVLTPSHPQYTEFTAQLDRSRTKLHDVQHAPKLVALQQLLNDCGIGLSESTADVSQPVVGQHRALVFCQLKSMLDIVERDLFRALLPSLMYLRLDGSVPVANRHAIVNRFNNDPSIDVLLLTTHVGGLGLNLTGADTVIFVEHDWNPMKDLQAMDRAHRIGQKKVVNVYRLIARNTLEEKIMGLQKFKLNIANTVINEDNQSLTSMGTDQLLDLFTLDAAQDSSKSNQSSSNSANRSAKAIMEGMEELWDSEQYDTEYSLESFMSSVAHGNNVSKD